MRLALNLCALSGLVLVFTVRLHAAPDWRGSISQIPGSVPCNAGGVHGKVGELTAFSHSGGGTSSMQSTGGVGAHWGFDANNSQYQHADAPFKEKKNAVVHQYARFSTDPATLTVNLTSTVTQAGSANRFKQDDPQWWWDSTATVADSKPACALWTPSGGWQSINPTVSQDQRASATGGDAGNQHPTPPNAPTSNNNNSTTPPSSTSQIRLPSATNGVYASTFGLPTSGGSFKVSASVTFMSTGTACVDNAVVNNDKLELSFDFTTSAQ